MDESKEWLRQMKSGENSEAFVQWRELNSSPIAALAFQNGVPHNQSGKLLKEVFNRIYNQLLEVDSLDVDFTLYRITTELLPGYIEADQAIRAPEQFHFAEDEELHNALQQLDMTDRMAFTLLHFHAKSLEEVSALLSIDPEKLQSIVGASLETIQKNLALADHQLDKRLTLLAKSYNRMNFPKPDNEMPADLPAEPLPKEPPKSKTGKRLVVMLAAALLIGVLFISSFLMDGQDSADPANSEETVEEIAKKAEEWREQYEFIRNSSPELMGISTEIYEELPYVNAADRFAAGILSEENIERMSDDPKGLENQFTRVLFYIQTPRGMVELLEDNPLSAEETDLFIYTFAEKTEQLMEASNQLLEEYNEEFDNAVLDGERSEIQLLANQANYSEGPSNLLSGMEEQMLTPYPHPAEERFISRRELRDLYGISTLMNDWTMASNLMTLQREPFYDETGLLLRLDEAAHVLMELEHYLLDEHSRSMLYTGFLEKFRELFWLVLKGSENEPVFNADGVVKEEYQSAWNTLAASQKNPILSVLLPILQEMEETEWTNSRTYDDLSPLEISGAMNMEMAGILSEGMPNGHMLTDPEFIDIRNFSYEDTEELYNQFVLEYDLELLSGKSPSEVYFLYQLANRNEDPETMWHLLYENGEKPNKQEFLNQWKQLPDIAEEARWLEYTENSFYRSRENLLVQLTINYSIEPELYRDGPVLITAENDVWLIKYQFSENYSSEQLKGEFLEQVLSLYDEKGWEKATPAEIFGVILVAKQKSDYGTLEELMDEFFDHQESKDVQESVNSMGLPLLEDLVGLSFYTDVTLEAGQPSMGSVTMRTRGDTMINMFSMLQTEEGWKLIY